MPNNNKRQKGNTEIIEMGNTFQYEIIKVIDKAYPENEYIDFTGCEPGGKSQYIEQLGNKQANNGVTEKNGVSKRKTAKAETSR